MTLNSSTQKLFCGYFQYDTGIILGHAWTWFGYSSRQRKRMDKGIVLWKSKQVKTLIATGGKGFFNPTSRPLGDLSKGYLLKKGVSENDIFVENTSQNTYQNAKAALSIMKLYNLHSAVVITSSDHMGRARKVFKDMFPKDIRLDFAISDYFAGIWTIWDFFWHSAGWIKYMFRQKNKVLPNS